ncbi:hypothetical protein ADEAN_000117900 [Angomonas deanei]|uniref:C3H1-type domain-containing protein n=1 Tax=Angomonas deanei TaxID=59799 RepID=A0A7G2C260_9TRYP|nr:hypothetical protein ADEAN_000117900 [Angomonas deanei]
MSVPLRRSLSAGNLPSKVSPHKANLSQSISPKGLSLTAEAHHSTGLALPTPNANDINNNKEEDGYDSDTLSLEFNVKTQCFVLQSDSDEEEQPHVPVMISAPRQTTSNNNNNNNKMEKLSMPVPTNPTTQQLSPSAPVYMPPQQTAAPMYYPYYYPTAPAPQPLYYYPPAAPMMMMPPYLPQPYPPQDPRMTMMMPAPYLPPPPQVDEEASEPDEIEIPYEIARLIRPCLKPKKDRRKSGRRLRSPFYYYEKVLAAESVNDDPHYEQYSYKKYDPYSFRVYRCPRYVKGDLDSCRYGRDCFFFHSNRDQRTIEANMHSELADVNDVFTWLQHGGGSRRHK